MKFCIILFCVIVLWIPQSIVAESLYPGQDKGVETWTDIKTGIDWRYRVEDGEIVIESGESCLPAISSLTRGIIEVPALIPTRNGLFPVVSIGFSAFYGCSGVQSVIIPEGVRTIDASAFEKCGNLISVVLPKSLIEICSYAFCECGNLKEIDIPEGVTSIGSLAFYKCRSLILISVPNSVVHIGYNAFQECSSLGSGFVVVNGWLLTYNGECTETVKLGSDVKRIAGGAFCDQKNIKTIELPNTICSICPGAFDSCGNLEKISIPDGIHEIEDSVFFMCENLSDVEIPESVEHISDYAFYGCSKLASFKFPTNLCSIGKYAFRECTALEAIELPDGLQSISDYAFWGCGALKKLVIPKTLTEIGACAFGGNVRFSAVYLSDIIAWCKANCQDCPLAVADHVYLDGEELVDLCIPEGVKKIPHNAFKACNSIRSVSFPSGLECIGGSAFAGCDGIKEVVIPEGVTNIGSGAFSHCIGLLRLVVPSSAVTIGASAFEECSNLNYVQFEVPSTGVFSRREIGWDAFAGCSNIEMIDIGDLASWCQTEFVGYRANPLSYASVFRINGVTASNLVVPEGVTEIKEFCFYGVCGIESIETPTSVENIGTSAFENCKYLIRASFAKGLKSIGTCSFAGCSNLRTVDMPDDVQTIGISAFDGCSSLSHIDLQEGLVRIDEQAFSCTALTSVRIPSTIEFIGGKAFAWSKLNAVFFEGNAPMTIGASIYYLTSSKLITYVHHNSMGWEYADDDMLPTKWPIGDDYSRPIEHNPDDITYAVKFDLGSLGEFSGGGWLNQTVREGCAAKAPRVVAKADWKFVGWDREFSCVTSNLDVNALYAPSPREDGSYEDLVNGRRWRYHVKEGVASIDGVVSRSTIQDIVVPELLGGCIVKTISDSAFSRHSDFTAIVLPESLTLIGDRAFADCSLLESIVIPRGVTSIGRFAFDDCYALNLINVEEGNMNYKSANGMVLSADGSKVLICPPGVKNAIVPDGVKVIDEGAFYGCCKLMDIVFPEGLQVISRDAFTWCSSLEAVAFPSGLRSIGDYAFNVCQGLSSVEIPATVTNIGDNVFSGCTGLAAVTIPACVKRFADEFPLKSITKVALARYNGNNSFQALPGTLEVIVL